MSKQLQIPHNLTNSQVRVFILNDGNHFVKAVVNLKSVSKSICI